MSVDEMWDKLVDDGIATEEECQLVTDINGYTEKPCWIYFMQEQVIEILNRWRTRDDHIC